MKYDVISVGIMVADVIVDPVNSYPKKGQLLNVDSIKLYSGGNAMTVGINVSKLGLKSALIGMVGNDHFGKFLLSCLDENSIATTGVAVTDKAQTSASVLLSDSDGERSFFHIKGANNIFDIDDIDFDLVNEGNIVFVTGSLLMSSFDGKSTVEFLKKCKEMGKTTALDVCWDSTVDCSWILNEAMPYIDIFMPSIDEAKMIAGCDEVSDMADTFIRNGAKSVVIKCGSKGCYVKENDTSDGYMVSGNKVENVVDTTGAGDSFCSGFLSAYAKGFSLKDCARFGNAVGACCVQNQGATSGTLSFEDTLKLMK